MEQSLVEAVASSLVREFLNRKGLKKTSSVLEAEFPRPPLSVNNRNELRSVLHLEALYKENKLADRPLKTLLEIITKYFLENFGKNKNSKMTGDQSTEAAGIRGDRRKDLEALHIDVYDLSDEDAGESSAVSDTSVTQHRRSAGNKPSYNPKEPPKAPGETCRRPERSSGRGSTCDGGADLTRALTGETPECPADAKRPKSSRIVRGMMSGPVASGPEDTMKKRGQRRPPAACPSVPARDDALSNGHLGKAEEPTGGPPNPALRLGREFSAKLLLTPSSNPAPRSPSLTPITKQRPPLEEAAGSGADAYRDFRARLSSGAEQGKAQQPSKKSEGASDSRRKSYTSLTREDAEDELRLDDVEEDLDSIDAARIPPFLGSSKAQPEGKALDLQRATELKKLLFGSALRGFSQEWKMQSFTFSDTKNLKYGIVQKKGGPCGVLAAVQACVLKHLLFGKESDLSRPLQPSDTVRTRCLGKALADILWRAGDGKEAAVTLSSGRQQFSAAGRYKADGILESLILYGFTSYEDLETFLQQNINQFERGPFGCILLTVSVVFSRTFDLVQKDFDDLANCLIGSHAYCTQELVNLILGGRAVSNVFNDVMELDSGNGSVTVLKGISCRGDVGFLSLFEHHNVCQVGSYLKTPKYPIWVVCSESHFSLLFCLKKELTSDWKAERRFDLYYYDGLANQQEEIRLTVDTSGASIEEEDTDLIPPLECCIRTKWKGAAVDWNGADPIL